MRGETIVQGINGDTWWEEMPNFIVLGHELIHALRIDQGRHIPYLSLDGALIHTFQHPEQGWIAALLYTEEAYTIGIGHSARRRMALSENALRWEHNLPRRITHWGRPIDEN